MDFAVSSVALRKSVRTSVILPEEAHTRIQALAEANNVSAAWVIRAAILRFLEEHGDQTQLPLKLPRKATGR
jgi:predicted DNA-binding protein